MLTSNIAVPLKDQVRNEWTGAESLELDADDMLFAAALIGANLRVSDEAWRGTFYCLAVRHGH